MNNFHLAGVPSGVSGNPEKPTTAHWTLGMQNTSATSSSVCAKCNVSCVILITTPQSLLLDVRNGNTLKTDSTWKVLQVQQLLKLQVAQKSDNMPQENHKLTTEIQSPHLISRTRNTCPANQVVPSSSLQAQTTDILVPLRIPHREVTMVPLPDNSTPDKATIKAIPLLDREQWTSSQASLDNLALVLNRSMARV
jgi:hypothetical protein